MDASGVFDQTICAPLVSGGGGDGGGMETSGDKPYTRHTRRVTQGRAPITCIVSQYWASRRPKRGDAARDLDSLYLLLTYIP